ASRDPALFVYPCGGVVVEQHVRRPTTLFAAEIQLSRGKILELADVVRRRPERSSQLLASRYPRRINVDCPGSVFEDVPGHGLLGEGLTGEHDRLKRGLQRRTPTIPLLGLGSGWGGVLGVSVAVRIGLLGEVAVNGALQ